MLTELKCHRCGGEIGTSAVPYCPRCYGGHYGITTWPLDGKVQDTCICALGSPGFSVCGLVCPAHWREAVNHLQWHIDELHQKMDAASGRFTHMQCENEKLREQLAALTDRSAHVRQGL